MSLLSPDSLPQTGAAAQHRSPYTVRTLHKSKLHPILMQHICAYKLAAAYKMTLIYFLINIHINNQSTLYKVNDVLLTPKGLRGVFSKKHSKTAVSSSRSPTDFFSIFFHF
jgi:hypothetical protein